MMNIRIINIKNYKPLDGEVLIKVDRSSVLGNPYHVGNDTVTQRTYACDMYRDYFRRVTDENSTDKTLFKFFCYSIQKKPFMRELRRIYKLVKQGTPVALGCWCFPVKCHAETIMEYILKLLELDAEDSEQDK